MNSVISNLGKAIVYCIIPVPVLVGATIVWLMKTWVELSYNVEKINALINLEKVNDNSLSEYQVYSKN